MGMVPTGRKVSGLSYAVLSYPVSNGHVSIFVLWPVRGDSTSWQIRTRYTRSLLAKAISPVPPQDAVERMERIRDSIQRCLLRHEANQIQWMSAVDAEQRLR
jgi:hypothetical protein